MSTTISNVILNLVSNIISTNIPLPKVEKEVCVGNILIKIGVNQNGNDRQV